MYNRYVEHYFSHFQLARKTAAAPIMIDPEAPSLVNAGLGVGPSATPGILARLAGHFGGSSAPTPTPAPTIKPEITTAGNLRGAMAATELGQ